MDAGHRILDEAGYNRAPCESNGDGRSKEVVDRGHGVEDEACYERASCSSVNKDAVDGGHGVLNKAGPARAPCSSNGVEWSKEDEVDSGRWSQGFALSESGACFLQQQRD